MGGKNTFGAQAHDIFNNLPKTIRVIKDRKVFIKETKRYYRDTARVQIITSHFTNCEVKSNY